MLRSVRLSFAAVVTVLAIAATISACGGNQRQKTLRATFITAKTACDGLDAFDRAKQEAIIESADPTVTTKAEVEAKLDAHVARMDRAYAACRLAIETIAAASFEKDDLSLRAAMETAQKLYNEVKALKGDS